MFPILLTVLALAIDGNALKITLEGRGIQTQAKCSNDFTWADNSKGEIPCLVAARIIGNCNTGNWNIPAVNSTSHYTPPDSAEKSSNPCTCSWATYNLLSACTACQGFDSSVFTWAGYMEKCNTKDLSSTGYPFSQVPFPPVTSIPYWAMTDPHTWPNQKFDVTAAKALDDKNLPDIDGPPVKKTSTTGPIVGGVIGGLAVIGLALGAAFFLKSRKMKQHRRGAVASAYGPTHARKESNTSQLSQSSGTDMNLPYMRIQSPQSFATTQLSHPPMSPGSTFHTRTGSVNSLSYFGSIHNSAAYNTSPPPPPQRQLSPPIPLSIHNPSANPEDIIVPFTLQPLTNSQAEISRQGSSTNLADRKRADGSIVPVYDPPSAPPQAMISDEVAIPSASRRPKVNPPAYTPYPGQGPQITSTQTPPRSRPRHTQQGSADTQHSWDSGRSGDTAKPGGGGSISTIGDVIGHMGFGTNATVSGMDGTVATGQSGNMADPRGSDSITRHDLA
ncbi:hypothetical protein BDZ94DRAFT_1250076 [Collybia nuda]|uniref:Uncharacterized protein n=1 Tax=Collybia nuda TaxID=64659 RepID=A0A9P6CI42_9AGAR|nr:hypothetical protein BDZ94DRAFT_1250076 [Collybia nuda]